MIFSKFFKAKWQNKNSNIRIQAINDELDPLNAQEQAILLELLTNDDVELVRRAALIKLHSFEYYLLASKNNKNEKLKTFASKQVVQMLLGEHRLKLSLPEKQQFLADIDDYPKKNTLLESWLFVEQDAELIQKIFTKLAKPQLLSTLFAKTTNETVQTFLLAQVNELSLLEKLAKKVLNATAKSSIEEKIAQLTLRAEKPLKVRKQVQLLLSKLLALKDIVHYGDMLIKREQLIAQWQIMLEDLVLFDAEEQTSLITKYQSIINQLDKTFAVKAEQYQQDKIAQKIQLEQQQFKQQLDDEINTINQQLVTSVFENELIEEQIFVTKLEKLMQTLNDCSLNDADKSVYQDKIKQQQKRLSQLGEIAQSVSQATQLISKIAQLALPATLQEFNERNVVYQDWLLQWHKVEKQSDGLLPESITMAYQEINQRWQQGLKPFISQQNKLFNQTRKKLHDLKRLLHSGKYNTCFGLFKKTQQQYEALSGQQQQRLQRDFVNISEKIAELSDWEHYIATPKKQELLIEVQKLVAKPCDNPNDQADQVKQYRKQWNILGHADDEIDQTLNEQFNDSCEQAFAPCRAFYGEQEKIREQNYQQRAKVIEQAKVLVQQLETDRLTDKNIDWKLLDNNYNKINQNWQKAGEVERNKYKPLLTQFMLTLSPIKAAINEYHLKNSELKKQLVFQAEQMLADTDINQAVHNVKNLQAKWREIGYAGARQDNKLWQLFRKANDQIFANRDQNKAEEQNILLQKEQSFQQSLTNLKEQFSGELSVIQLQNLVADVNDLLSQLANNKPIIKRMVQQTEQFINEIKATITIRKGKDKQLQWHTIFTLIKQIANDQINHHDLVEHPLFEQLSSTWQKKLLEVIKTECNADRDVKTLELEILAGIESPKELSKQRMSVQVALMQEQMTAGKNINLENMFLSWLQLGKLAKNDLLQIDRIAPIFVNSNG